MLSDWPVRSLTQSHLRPSPKVSVYERGSFGRGCEIDSGRLPYDHHHEEHDHHEYPHHGPNYPNNDQSSRKKTQYF